MSEFVNHKNEVAVKSSIASMTACIVIVLLSICSQAFAYSKDQWNQPELIFENPDLRSNRFEIQPDQLVLITGDKDENGFYEAELRSKEGEQLQLVGFVRPKSKKFSVNGYSGTTDPGLRRFGYKGYLYPTDVYERHFKVKGYWNPKDPMMRHFGYPNR
jgi:hypothetical protein